MDGIERKDALSVIDHRTGRQYELPIEHGTVRAMDLRQIKTGLDDFGLMTYDPGLTNTAVCKSAITFIDGERGILKYRGYPIEDLVERCDFLDIAYLLINGELPSEPERARFEDEIRKEQETIWNVTRIGRVNAGFYDSSHPMPLLMGLVTALGSHYPDARQVDVPEIRRKHAIRLIALMPILAALAIRGSRGLPPLFPPLGSARKWEEVFLWCVFADSDDVRQPYVPNSVLVRAIGVLAILHADHEQNAGTSTLRSVASTKADPYTATTAAIGALFGPLHGGANEAVLKMLDDIGSLNAVPRLIEEVKAGQRRLMGFGHRVYKAYDPRARVIRELAYKVFEVTGKNPKIDLAMELERIALEDEYFVSRRLYPNVDFYSGIIYEAMGFRPEEMTVLFALGRIAGWMAHYLELFEDPEFRIVRPRQIYTGVMERGS